MRRWTPINVLITQMESVKLLPLFPVNCEWHINKSESVSFCVRSLNQFAVLCAECANLTFPVVLEESSHSKSHTNVHNRPLALALFSWRAATLFDPLPRLTKKHRVLLKRIGDHLHTHAGFTFFLACTLPLYFMSKESRFQFEGSFSLNVFINRPTGLCASADLRVTLFANGTLLFCVDRSMYHVSHPKHAYQSLNNMDMSTYRLGQSHESREIVFDAFHHVQKKISVLHLLNVSTGFAQFHLFLRPNDGTAKSVECVCDQIVHFLNLLLELKHHMRKTRTTLEKEGFRLEGKSQSANPIFNGMQLQVPRLSIKTQFEPAATINCYRVGPDKANTLKAWFDLGVATPATLPDRKDETKVETNPETKQAN